MAWPLSWDRIDLSSVRRNTGDARSLSLSLSLSVSLCLSSIEEHRSRGNFIREKTFLNSSLDGLSLKGMENSKLVERDSTWLLADRFWTDRSKFRKIEHFCRDEFDGCSKFFHFNFFLKEGWLKRADIF